MRAGQHHVDAERVHLDFQPRERGDRIDDERDIRILGENRADFLQRIHDAGRGFTVGQRDGVEFAGRQLAIDVLRVDMFSPFHLEGLGVFSTALCNIEPFVGERAAHAAQHATIDQVPD